MFNLEKESGRGSKQERQLFDLEMEMQNIQSANKIKNQVKENITLLQGALRSGQEKELFEKFQVLVDGFLAVEKVLNRINQKIG